MLVVLGPSYPLSFVCCKARSAGRMAAIAAGAPAAKDAGYHCSCAPVGYWRPSWLKAVTSGALDNFISPP